ncbi:hypothetical protein ABG067_000697 [Albugo candida]
MSDAMRQDHRRYLKDQDIQALFVQIVGSLLITKPDNPIGHIAEYLVSTYPNETKSVSKFFSKPLSKEHNSNYVDASSGFDAKEYCASEVTSSEESYSDEENDGDVLNDIYTPEPPFPISRARRTSVSAETLDPLSVRNDKRIVHAKSNKEREQIRKIVSGNILFQSLDENQLGIVLDAMFPKIFEPEDIIIKQGDDGDNFYILESGVCEVYKDGELVQTCTEAMSFGELALMYNAPRAATVQAREKSKAWALDRHTFKYIIMETTLRTRQAHRGFIERVPILESLSDTERTTIVDALRVEHFQDGQVIIQQGDDGNHFYIIEEGEAMCSKRVSSDALSQDMGTLQSGSYFGEIALLTARPRQATVTAKGPVKCLVLDRKTFKRVMGPLEDILKRNIDKYHLFMANNI